MNSSYNQPVCLTLRAHLDCDMQNGVCLAGWLTGMQISAEFHSPKNKRRNKHCGADSGNTGLGIKEHFARAEVV